MGDIVERGRHGSRFAGGVDDDVEEIAARQPRQLLQRVWPYRDRLIDAEDAAAEVEPVRPNVQRGDRAAIQLGEDHAADADRAGPDDEDAVSLLRIGAAHGVGADREELDHRRLVERDAVGDRHVVLRHTDIVRHPAVDVDAEDGDALTAIGLAAPTGDAMAAGEIRDHEDLLPDGDAAARTRLGDFAGQFVSDHARIVEKRMRALVDMEVRAADPGAPDAHDHLTGPWRRPRPLDHGQFTGFDAKQGPQSRSSPTQILVRYG